jgi:hypothetical protein
VASKIRSDPKSLEKFGEVVNHPQFEQTMLTAIANPSGAVAKKVMKLILPIIRIGGCTVPFGPGESAHAMSTLYAKVHMYGPPSIFITFSPPDMDHVLTLRLATEAKSNEDEHVKGTNFLDVNLPIFPDLCKRMEMVASNPAAAARIYKKLVDAVLECLFVLPIGSSHKKTKPLSDRPPCVFGCHLTAMSLVTETQARGSLHGHACGFGGLLPWLLQCIAEDPELRKVAGEAIDSAVLTRLPAWVFEEKVKRREEARKAKLVARATGNTSVMVPVNDRRWALQSPFPLPSREFVNTLDPDNKELASPFDKRWCNVNGAFDFVNMGYVDCMSCVTYESYHKWINMLHIVLFVLLMYITFIHAGDTNDHDQHAGTCHKGAAGQYGCRLAQPQTLRIEPTGPVQLEMDDQRMEDDKFMFNVVAMDYIEKLRTRASSMLSYFEAPLLPPDDRVIVWDTHRPNEHDANVIAFNRACSVVLGCNTSMNQLGAWEQSKSTAFYMFKYMLKNNLSSLQLCRLSSKQRKLLIGFRLSQKIQELLYALCNTFSLEHLTTQRV